MVFDRKHHTFAEPVVGNRYILAVNEQTARNHVLERHSLGGQMLAQRFARGRGVADAELGNRFFAQTPVSHIAPRCRALSALKIFCKKLRRELKDIIKAPPLVAGV